MNPSREVAFPTTVATCSLNVRVLSGVDRNSQLAHSVLLGHWGLMNIDDITGRSPFSGEGDMFTFFSIKFHVP